MLAELLAMSAAGPDGPQQLLALELGARGVALRQDLLVVGELAVDEPADEVDALEVEQHLVASPGRARARPGRRCRQDPRRARRARGPG